MSVVKKLIIQGVRSFNPNENKHQMIEFQTPLTLILGINGSGKTTIIEALKYAITNTLPPNCNKGSSFVNDPKLTNGYETMGIVKLEVIDHRGNKVVTTRKVKVTVKDRHGNLTKKELDPTMRVTDTNGVTKEVNGKCVDIKVEMCRVMGVSEAILNNVIFCHQEDSCWPLDEGKKVKEKFDAIFNTTMYIKCLDVFTKQDKELGIRVKIEGEKLGYCIENRQIARRKKKEVGEKEIALKSLSDEVDVLERDVKELESRLHQLDEIEREYAVIANKVSVTEGKVESGQKQIEEIKANIREEFTGDISTLQKAILDFDKQRNQKIAQQKQLEQELKVKEDELRELSKQKSRYLVEEGKFQQEESAQNERLENLALHIADIIKLAKKLKEGSQDISFSSNINSCIDVCETDPDSLSPEMVIKSLSSALRARDSETNKIKAQYEKEEKELQTNIDNLRTKKASLETEIEMKKKQVDENVVAARELRGRLAAIDSSSETLDSLEAEEKSFTKELQSITSSGIIEKYENELRQLTKDIRELENQINDAADDVDLLSKDKGKLDQIAIFNKQKLQKQNECKEIMRRIEDDLRDVLGQLPETGLGRIFEDKKDELNSEYKNKRDAQKQLDRKLAVQDSELKRVKSDLKKKEDKVEDWKDKIEGVLEGRDFEEVYEDINSELNEAQKDSYYAEAGIYLYKKYLDKLEIKDCCPLCKRDIATKNEVQQLIKEIQSDSTKLKKKENPEVVRKLKTQLEELVELKPIWEEYQKYLDKEIPELKQKRSALETEVGELTESRDDINAALATLDHEKSILDKRGRDVALYENAKKEIKLRDENIASLEAARSDRAKVLGEKTNLSNAQTVLTDLKNDVKTKQMEKDNKSDMLNKKRVELNRITDQKNKVREQILKITSELQNREALEIQKKDLEELTKQLQEAGASLKLELPQVKSEITNAEKIKIDCVERKEKHLQMLRQEKESLEKQKAKLTDISQQMEDFERKKVKFEDVKQRSTKCKQQISKLETEKSVIDSEFETVKHDIANQETQYRNLKDNLAYKTKFLELSKLKEDLEEKKKVFASTRNKGVATERRELGLKHQNKSKKMNQLIGSKTEILVAINELKKELNDRPYVDAEKEYIERLVRKAVYEKAQKDVRRFKTALDQAIMQFHSKRMEMINRSLWEYWRQIYKGNDIDCIQIRTEASNSNIPGAPGTGHKVKLDTGRGRKNYNYRVVMVRRGTELDMRGRCSAGQRVLASLIIRIALADSFSSRCGIITLDEPTTNLDQKNVNSLADALAALAQRMSKQKNFQLVVITHDQEFTERLSVIDSVEKYWKVSRDNMGFSQITVVPKRG